MLPAIAVAPYVALLGGEAELTLSTEVDAAFWVPLSALEERQAWSDVELQLRGERRTFPAFLHRGYVIWGLTERILTQFRSRLAP